MNKSLLIAALAGVCFAGSAMAYSPKETTTQPPALKLVPSKVVAPTDLPRAFANAVVNVEFTLDAAGRPQNIRILAVTDASVTRQLVAALSQWRFDPAANAAIAPRKRFVLPLKIVPEV